MRVLDHQTLSPFARKVRVVLAEKNLEFTLKLEKVLKAPLARPSRFLTSVAVV